MTTWISPSEGAKRFRTLAQMIENESVKALRRATHRWRLKAYEMFSRRGLGKVFGESAVLGTTRQRASTSQARVIIKRETAKKTGEGQFQSGLRLRGFAALVEGGGRTKPHTINARGDGVLGPLGMNARGKPFFARSVFQRLGARIKKNPFAEEAGRQAQPDFVREMQVAKDRSVELAKLGD